MGGDKNRLRGDLPVGSLIPPMLMCEEESAELERLGKDYPDAYDAVMNALYHLGWDDEKVARGRVDTANGSTRLLDALALVRGLMEDTENGGRSLVKGAPPGALIRDVMTVLDPESGAPERCILNWEFIRLTAPKKIEFLCNQLGVNPALPVGVVNDYGMDVITGGEKIPGGKGWFCRDLDNLPAEWADTLRDMILEHAPPSGMRIKGKSGEEAHKEKSRKVLRSLTRLRAWISSRDFKMKSVIRHLRTNDVTGAIRHAFSPAEGSPYSFLLSDAYLNKSTAGKLAYERALFPVPVAPPPPTPTATLKKAETPTKTSPAVAPVPPSPPPQKKEAPGMSRAEFAEITKLTNLPRRCEEVLWDVLTEFDMTTTDATDGVNRYVKSRYVSEAKDIAKRVRRLVEIAKRPSFKEASKIGFVIERDLRDAIKGAIRPPDIPRFEFLLSDEYLLKTEKERLRHEAKMIERKLIPTPEEIEAREHAKEDAQIRALIQEAELAAGAAQKEKEKEMPKPVAPVEAVVPPAPAPKVSPTPPPASVPVYPVPLQSIFQALGKPDYNPTWKSAIVCALNTLKFGVGPAQNFYVNPDKVKIVEDIVLRMIMLYDLRTAVQAARKADPTLARRRIGGPLNMYAETIAAIRGYVTENPVPPTNMLSDAYLSTSPAELATREYRVRVGLTKPVCPEPETVQLTLKVDEPAAAPAAVEEPATTGSDRAEAVYDAAMAAFQSLRDLFDEVRGKDPYPAAVTRRAMEEFMARVGRLEIKK